MTYIGNIKSAPFSEKLAYIKSNGNYVKEDLIRRINKVAENTDVPTDFVFLVDSILEKINQKKYHHEYFKRTIEKQKLKSKQRLLNKHACDCGGRYSDSSKHTHVKSKRHLKFLATAQ